MANQEHLNILKQGVTAWNQWRKEHPEIKPDLSFATLIRANLSGADLSYAELDNADLRNANLSKANLDYAYPIQANLSYTDLSGARLSCAYLTGADLSYANLSDADLSDADLSYAELDNADLSRANLSSTTLVGTNLTNARLKECKIYGISVWDTQLDGAEQFDLTITPEDQPTITVDNLKVAQFIYLLLNNAEIRHVINTLTTKAVLILGRFTPQRKKVLDALRDKLRTMDYLPIVFDFKKAANRDLTETISILAHIARFVIADITDAKSIPQELKTIVPNLPSVPVQPLLQTRAKEYSMFEHFKSYPWVLETYRYTTTNHLLSSLKEHVIEPAETKAKELALERANKLERS